MPDLIYIEDEVREHPRTQALLSRYPKASTVPIERYGEVFNRKGQDFRAQKQHPALIIARKHRQLVLPTPEGYGIGSRNNFYFSHLLNCPYDCRYCFLQGLYRSAHHVLFVNFEDFQSAIDERIADCNDGTSPAHKKQNTALESGTPPKKAKLRAQSPDSPTSSASPGCSLPSPNEAPVFFSGYDCDSLAYEGVTGFAEDFLAFFAQRPGALLELRTKSIHIAPLLAREPLSNVVVAFSFTPDAMAQAQEHRAPAVKRRIEAAAKLARQGWPIGLRLDPLLYRPNFEADYEQLIHDLLANIPVDSIHSISAGPLRFPKAMYQKIAHLYPEEALLAGPMITYRSSPDGETKTAPKSGAMVSYRRPLERRLHATVQRLLKNRVPESIYFSCTPADWEHATDEQPFP